jgi:hypothetical protein
VLVDHGEPHGAQVVALDQLGDLGRPLRSLGGRQAVPGREPGLPDALGYCSHSCTLRAYIVIDLVFGNPG